MRRTALSAVILLAMAAISQTQGLDPSWRVQDLNRRDDGVKRLELWVESVQAHRAGIPDEGTRRIASWSPSDLDDLTIELASLLALMDDPRHSQFSVWIERGRNAGRRRVVYSGSEVERLRHLARALGGRGPNDLRTRDEEARVAAARNRLLKRAVTMHTTIALNRQENSDRETNLLDTKWEGIVQFADGLQVGLDSRANHWKFARALLDLVAPAPARDPAVREWYRASSAVLLRRLQLHLDHMEQALRLFPDDAVLLMLGGSVHEGLASARVQAFVKSAIVPKGVVLRVDSSRSELGRAESLFRRALTIDPRTLEARVRLGRVLSLQEKYADALTELRRLDASAPPLLQYYASLFAGDAAEGLGSADEARAAYERAATLYPRAQAPRFALSQLATSSGDATRATGALEPVLSAEPDPPLADDPFWTYHTAAGRDAEAWLGEAFRTLAIEGAP